MSDTIYTIQRLKDDGVTWGQDVTFTTAALSSATRKLVNQGQDTCSLVFAGMRPPRLGGYKAGEYIRILRDGSGWFTGRVVSPERTAAGNSESAKLTLYGPWWELANIVYQQVGLFYSILGELDTNPTVTATQDGPTINDGNALLQISPQPSPLLSSSIILTGGSDNALPLDAAATILAALEYAISQKSRFQVGTVGINQAIPAEQLTDPTCADCVKRVLRWLPGVTCWFDYTTDPPTCNIQSRANRPALTLQMGGATPQVKDASISARPDLVLPGVTVQYLRRIEVSTAVPAVGASPATSVNSTLYTLQTETAGPQPVGIGSLVVTIELTGGSSASDGTGNGQTFEQTPSGLAAAIFAARSALPFEGTINLAGQDLRPVGNWIGRTVNITGGDAEWLSMAAEIQTTSENTATGATVLNIGPPDHLGASDLAALLKASRLRQYVDPTTATIRTAGSVIVPPVDPPPKAPPGKMPGNSGPSNAPDGGTTTQSGFTGLIYAYSGQLKTPPHKVGDRFRPNPPGNDVETPVPDPSSGSSQAPENPTGGTTDHFFASGSYGATVQAGGPGASGPWWVEASESDSAHSEGTLDLTSFSPLNYIYAELRGTQTVSTSSGGTQVTPHQVPVTGLLGLRTGGYRVYAPEGASHVSHPVISVSGLGKSGSISIDSLYLVERGKKVGG